MFLSNSTQSSLRLTSTDITVVSLSLSSGSITKLYQQPLDSGIVTGVNVDIPRLTTALRQAVKSSRLHPPVALGFPYHPRQFTLLNRLFAAVTSSGIRLHAFEPASLTLARFALTPEPVGVLEIRHSDSTYVLVSPDQPAPVSVTISQPEQIVDKLQSLPSRQLLICGEGATTDWQAFLHRELNVPVAEVSLPPLKNLPPFPARFAVALALAEARQF